MKIKTKYLGSKVYHPILEQMILIEKGNEERYAKLGLDIFVTPRKPKLQKKENAKTTKRRDGGTSSNVGRKDDDK